MNILSKILIVVFISVSVTSINAQDDADAVSTDGIVTVTSKYSIWRYGKGTGFFVAPHTLVTNFHVIAGAIWKLQGDISKNLYIAHPETEKYIPVHSIQALDAGNDLAILHIKDYESSVYYDEFFEESKETLPSLEAYIFDQRKRFFSIIARLFSSLAYNFDRRAKFSSRIEGLLSSYYASQTIKTLSFSFDSFYFDGLSGSPAFSDGKVIGVLSSADNGGNKGVGKPKAFLSSPKALKKLLQSPFFNCQTIECVKKNMLLPESDRVQEYELIDSEIAHTMYLAEQGLKGVQHNLGVMYERGEGVAKDYKKAVEWYKKAAEQGDMYAQFNLGWMYVEGQGVVQNYKKAVKWFRKAAEQGHAKAQFYLGWMYEYGAGVAQDSKEATNWYRKAAEQGHAKAQYNLGLLMYAHGEGVVEDYKEAVKWLRLAAEQGDMDAQIKLGVIYAYGQGIAEDKEEAVEEWYRKATEQGHADAQSHLGWMYAKAEDYQEAVRWFRLAAEQGHAKAQYNLGLMYDYGLGIAKDKEEAVRWFRLAAEQGDMDAQYKLGVMYAKGKGVAKDNSEAAKWLRLAAEQGYMPAKIYLGWMYVKGKGLAKDSSEAVVVKQGHVEKTDCEVAFK